jgi:predicted dehydrogenase
MRLGLVGYGVGGKYFHAPFILAARGVELVGVVARSASAIEQVHADLPGVAVFPSLTAMIAAGGLDAVTITTPPQTRRDLVLEAVAAGIHVVADKPFAPDAEAGRALAAAAKEAGVIVNVFHNRRRDADILTLKSVIDSGALGDLWRIDSRFDLDQPEQLEVGETGGLLRDLGAHLVDQALWLLGPATHVYATLDYTDRFGERTDCGFVVSLRHESGATSTISSSKLNRLHTRELRAYGKRGSYVVRSTDVQAQAIFAGRRPIDEPETWGIDAPEHWGTLSTDAGVSIVPSVQANYATYYEEFAAAIAGTGAEPVPTEGAVHTLAVLDAARASATEGVVVRV